MTNQIDVSAPLFRAVSEFQSREETRYYLNGVYVQKHPERGALLIGTDGHRMLIAHDVDGVCKKPAIISSSADTFRPIGKDPAIKLSMTEDGIVTCGHYRSIKSCIIDGTYPDWARVVRPLVDLAKKREHGKPVFEPASFNAQYLADFHKIHKHLSTGQSAVKVVSFDKKDPALVLIPNQPHVFGVLMPLHNHNDDFAVPAFMRLVLEPGNVTKLAAEPKAKAPVKKAKAKPRKKAA